MQLPEMNIKINHDHGNFIEFQKSKMKYSIELIKRVSGIVIHFAPITPFFDILFYIQAVCTFFVPAIYTPTLA